MAVNRVNHKLEMKQTRFHYLAFEYMIEFKDGFIPLEVGVVEWSMAEGITKEYHAFIDPDNQRSILGLPDS